MVRYSLVAGASGNISAHRDQKIIITRKGAFLGSLSPEDFVKVDFHGSDPRASRDLVIHRTIYETIDTKFILHSHGIKTIVVSFLVDTFEPIDLEGRYVLGAVPVVEGEYDVERLSKNIAEKISESEVVVVKGHGAYACGDDPLEALARLVTLDQSCKIFYDYMILTK
jgi:L-fuculose-phosphate aldolase